MAEKGKREELRRIPTRKLLASIKKDLKRSVRQSAALRKSKKR